MPSGRPRVAYDRAVSLARVGRLWRDDGRFGRSLAAVVLVAAWVATWRPLVDPDAWWHLATGELITASGSIPATDPFSWLSREARFVEHSWLWDILLAGAWRAGGATAVSLLIVPVTGAVVWLVWELIGRTAPTVRPLARALFVLLAVIAALPLWAPRGQTFDVAFVLGTTLVLARYLRTGSASWLMALPVIGVLWANLHGSGALAFVASLLIALVTTSVGARWGRWPRRSVVPPLVAGFAAIAAAAANPYGVGLLAYPFDREVASAFSAVIAEWRSPDFGAATLWPIRALLAGIVLVAIWARGRSRDPFLLLSAAAWTFVALGSVRFVSIAAPLLVVAIAPAIGPAMGRWLPGGRVTVTAAPPSGSDASSEPARTPMLAITALAIAMILGAGWFIVDPARQAAAIERRMPVAAVAALDIAGCTSRLLPAYDWAGYVIWAGAREVGAYGNSAAEDVAAQAAVESVAIDPRPWLDDHDVGAVLMPPGGPLSHWLDEADDWVPAYRDAQATIHVRVGAPDCPAQFPDDVPAAPD